ncbi:MAG: hypothetical protein LUQ29_12445 [Methylococcaceae bacterium]|nr:hypothetical protein [Methylococcaceae bacterium]
MSFALQLAIHHVSMLQTLFQIEPVSLNQCVAWVGVGFIPLIVLECATGTQADAIRKLRSDVYKLIGR